MRPSKEAVHSVLDEMYRDFPRLTFNYVAGAGTLDKSCGKFTATDRYGKKIGEIDASENVPVMRLRAKVLGYKHRLQELLDDCGPE